MINLGKLKEIKDLRKAWPHEALDFIQVNPEFCVKSLRNLQDDI